MAKPLLMVLAILTIITTLSAFYLHAHLFLMSLVNAVGVLVAVTVFTA